MSDDLVKRLREGGEFERFMQAKKEGDELERFMLANRAADRIEKLEAKLADAEVIIHIIASDKWDEGEAVDLAREYLAELKGEKQ